MGLVLVLFAFSPHQGGQAQGPIHFTLGSSCCRSERSQGIKQGDKVEKLLPWLKGRRWGQVAFLGLVLAVNLFDLPAVHAQAAWGQNLARHLLSHPPQQRLRPLPVQEERQVPRPRPDQQTPR